MRVLVCLSCLCLGGCFVPLGPSPQPTLTLSPVRLHVERYTLEEVSP